MHRAALATVLVLAMAFVLVMRRDLDQILRKDAGHKPVLRVRQNFQPPPSLFAPASPVVNAHTAWTNALNASVRDLNQPAADNQLSVMGPMGPTCQNLEIYGSGDGEKRACGLRNATDCTVISIGSNNQWDFEEAVFDQLNCTVATFDCTAGAQVPSRIASRTRFYPICISGWDRVDENNRVYLAWPSLMRLINAQKAPDYLKMDIEGGEYEALATMLKEGFLMPRQVAFEIHTHRKTLGDVALIMESLYTQGGYFFVDQRPNIECRECTEVLISRVD